MTVTIECGKRRPVHRISGDGFTLQTVRTGETGTLTALASDPQAQQWLGWPKRQVLSAAEAARVREAGSSGGRHLDTLSPPFRYTVSLDSCPVAGAVDLLTDETLWYLGIFLAPELRGQGYGRRALAAAAEFCHRHLNLAEVLAGTHPENQACRRALEGAGFDLVPLHRRHVLPSGEETPVLWYLHRRQPSSRCTWFKLG